MEDFQITQKRPQMTQNDEKKLKTYKNMFLHSLEQVWMVFGSLGKISQFHATKILELIHCGKGTVISKQVTFPQFVGNLMKIILSIIFPFVWMSV